jgi:E3 ubiquitin-protein ligase DOA10
MEVRAGAQVRAGEMACGKIKSEVMVCWRMERKKERRTGAIQYMKYVPNTFKNRLNGLVYWWCRLQTRLSVF